MEKLHGIIYSDNVVKSLFLEFNIKDIYIIFDNYDNDKEIINSILDNNKTYNYLFYNVVEIKLIDVNNLKKYFSTDSNEYKLFINNKNALCIMVKVNNEDNMNLEDASVITLKTFIPIQK